MTDGKIEKLAVLIDADNAQPSIVNKALPNRRKSCRGWTVKGNLFER